MGVNIITIDDIRANKNPYISSADGYTEEDLQYHLSWDWLMPVVNKCLNIYHIKQMNDDLNFKFYDSMGDIKKTYKAVVEFIKEYNNTKEQDCDVIGSFDKNGDLI
jgi:hypothetical protein